MSSKTQSIKIQHGVCIYKQPLGKGRGSPNWYARVHLLINGRAVHTRTTRTTDSKLATRIAQDFYGECLAQRQLLKDGFVPAQGLGSGHAARFDKIADQFVDQAFLEAGDNEQAIRKAKDYKGAVQSWNGLSAFFGSKDVNAITTMDIREYLRFQAEKSQKGKLAPASQKRTLSTLSQVLRFALEQRLLTALPLLPKIKMQDNPRRWFEKDEYHRLHKTAYGLAQAAKCKGNLDEAHKWQELGEFVVFMVGSFLRPGEWKALRHSDIKVLKSGDHRFLEMNVRAGKTGTRQSVSMGSAVEVYERMVKRTGDNPSDHIFMPQYKNRQTAMDRMADRFEELMVRTGLKFDAEGQPRVMYSLRHTSLMLRITEGDVNVLHLAQNAGTSIEMLQRFYLKRLNPRTSVANLQSFR